MNAQLFNFHAASASLRSYNPGSSTDSSEPTGSSSSRVPYMSWNKGRCTAPYALCRYYHHCSTCGGTPHSMSCTSRPDRKLESTTRRRSRSPAASSSPSCKVWCHSLLVLGRLPFVRMLRLVLVVSSQNVLSICMVFQLDLVVLSLSRIIFL